MRILERQCRECGRIIPEKIVNPRMNQGDFNITAIAVNCNPKNPKNGHLQPCDFEEIE